MPRRYRDGQGECDGDGEGRGGGGMNLSMPPASLGDTDWVRCSFNFQIMFRGFFFLFCAPVLMAQGASVCHCPLVLAHYKTDVSIRCELPSDIEHFLRLFNGSSGYLDEVCIVSNRGGERGPGAVRVWVAGAEVGSVTRCCQPSHYWLPVVSCQHRGRAKTRLTNFHGTEQRLAALLAAASPPTIDCQLFAANTGAELKQGWKNLKVWSRG